MNKQDIAEQAYINGYKKGVKDFADKLQTLKPYCKGLKLIKKGSSKVANIYEVDDFLIEEIVKELTASGEELTKTPKTPCKHALKDELGDLYCGNDKSENLGDFCVCCGREIPEGRQVCPNCEKGEEK